MMAQDTIQEKKIQISKTKPVEQQLQCSAHSCTALINSTIIITSPFFHFLTG